jgi:hypothetical protein
LSVDFGEVEHPVHAEAIRNHSKISTPERVLKRHGDFSCFTVCLKKRLGLILVLALNGDGEIISLKVRHARHRIRRHQQKGAFREARVNDSVSGFRRRFKWRKLKMA